MKIKQITAAYFSATQTTEKMVCHIAGRLAETLHLDMKTFDFTLPDVRKKEAVFQPWELVVFGVPVYAGRVPNVLLKYLDMLKGNGALAVPVVMFGNRNYDEALKELRNILEVHGFHTIAAGAFVGEHSFSNTLGKGRPDDEDLKEGQQMAEKVAQMIETALYQSPVQLADESPMKGYYQPRDRHGNPIDIRKVKPKTSDKCINCGYCVSICPMGSINPEDVTQLTGICIKCCACVKRCPMGAKYFDDANYLYHKTELEEMYTRRAKNSIFYA